MNRGGPFQALTVSLSGLDPKGPRRAHSPTLTPQFSGILGPRHLIVASRQQESRDIADGLYVHRKVPPGYELDHGVPFTIAAA